MIDACSETCSILIDDYCSNRTAVLCPMGVKCSPWLRGMCITLVPLQHSASTHKWSLVSCSAYEQFHSNCQSTINENDYTGLCLRHVLQHSMNTTTKLKQAPKVPSEVDTTHVSLNINTVCILMNREQISDLVSLVSKACKLLKAIPTNEQPDKSSPGNLRKQYSQKYSGYNIIENLLCYSICLTMIFKTKKWTIIKDDLEKVFGEEDAKSFPRDLKSLFLAACVTPITLIQPQLMYGHNFTHSAFIDAAKWCLPLMLPEPIRQLEKCIIYAAMQFFLSLNHNLLHMHPAQKRSINGGGKKP